MKPIIIGIVAFETVIVIGGLIQGNSLVDTVKLIFWMTLTIAVWFGIIYGGVSFVRKITKRTSDK
jgi:hypothetical protein